MADRDLLSRALARTGREYPAGYGFALGYLDDGLTPSVLRDAARRVAAKALMGHGTIHHDHPDLVAFVVAQRNATKPEDWMIEAAQLVLQAAVGGDHLAGDVMARCGHPGYDVRTPPTSSSKRGRPDR